MCFQSTMLIQTQDRNYHSQMEKEIRKGSQVLNSKPTKRNLIRFWEQRTLLCESHAPCQPLCRQTQLYEPPREVRLFSQGEEALLAPPRRAGCYLWRHSSFTCVMPAPFSPSWKHFCQNNLLKTFVSLLCTNTCQLLAVCVYHTSSLDNSISTSGLG